MIVLDSSRFLAAASAADAAADHEMPRYEVATMSVMVSSEGALCP